MLKREIHSSYFCHNSLLKQYVAENERLRAILGEWSMRAANGDMAYPRMRSAAKRRGLEITSLSRPKASDFREFDLILAMDDQNKGILKAYNVWKARGNFPPDADKKVKLICSYCKKHNDKIVPDPYYGGAQGFEKVLDLLEDACESLVDGITAEN